MSGVRPGELLSLAELLTATGVTDVEALSEVVDAECEPDLWVVETDDGVEIGSGLRATCLAFPFTLAEFWATVDEVEAEAVELIEAAERQRHGHPSLIRRTFGAGSA